MKISYSKYQSICKKTKTTYDNTKTNVKIFTGKAYSQNAVNVY